MEGIGRRRDACQCVERGFHRDRLSVERLAWAYEQLLPARRTAVLPLSAESQQQPTHGDRRRPARHIPQTAQGG